MYVYECIDINVHILVHVNMRKFDINVLKVLITTIYGMRLHEYTYIHALIYLSIC